MWPHEAGKGPRTGPGHKGGADRKVMDQQSIRNAPFVTPPQGIEPGWIDFNGHLNMAYYLLVFDRGYEAVARALGMGATYAAERRMTTYTGDARVSYLREVHGDARVVTTFQLLDHDEKRLHAFQEMRHETEGWLAATCETLTLHIDMAGPKVCPFPDDVLARIEAMAAAQADLPRPEGAGRPIGIRRKPQARP